MAYPSQSNKENWLNRFLRVQQVSDAHLAQALQAALDSVDASLSSIDGKVGVGAATRRAQLLGNKGIITRVLQDLYRRLGDIIREGQSSAAEAAALAEWNDAKSIYDVIIQDADKRNVLEKSLEQSAKRNVQTMMTRILQTEQPLSKRIYKSQSIAKGQVSRAVDNHLAKGSSAADLAKDVRKFFDPKVPGGVNAAARRLARTEINNAFHAQSISDMQDRPWVNQVRWNLSGSHPAKQRHDKCDDYARIGLYSPDNVPPKPHPNCLCFMTPDMPDANSVINDYLAGKYNSWLAEHTDDGLRKSA